MITQDHIPNPVLPGAVNIMTSELDTGTSKLPPVGSIIPAGQIIEWKRNGEVSECYLWKTAKVHTILTTSASLKVYKGHLFAVGDTIFVTASRTILAVDKTTSDDYDIITLNATDSIAANAILYYRENPYLEDGFFFGFTKDAISIKQNQTTLSIPVYVGYLDKRIISDMLGSTTTLELMTPKHFLKLVPTATTSATERGFKIYTALLTQAGTADPSAIVLGDNDIGTIVWTRTGAGDYLGTLTDAFVEDKTGIIIPNIDNAKQTGAEWADKDTIRVDSFIADGTATDALLNNTLIEIRVYN